MCVLQSWTSKLSPTQSSAAPTPGAGLSHCRVLVCCPVPHVALQVSNPLQSPQLPFTGWWKQASCVILLSLLRYFPDHFHSLCHLLATLILYSTVVALVTPFVYFTQLRMLACRSYVIGYDICSLCSPLYLSNVTGLVTSETLICVPFIFFVT